MEYISTVSLKPKTWHFVGSSYNYVDREVILWINGSLHKRTAVAWPTELGTQQSVFMGAIPYNHFGAFKGRVSCVQLYDRVLTDLEIDDAKQSCSTAGKTSPFTFLLVLYMCVYFYLDI